MADLTDKTIIITGASRGIGAACVASCLEAGARVVAVARHMERLQDLQQLDRGDGRLLLSSCDMSQEQEVEALFQTVLHTAGGLHGLVQSAAVFESAPLEDMSLDMWQEVLAVNLTGVFLGLRTALRHMDQHGSIVNLGSLSGVPGVKKFAGFAAYNTSKYGVWALTECAALEAKAKGIRVNGVAPGAVDTAMLQKAAPGLAPAMSPEEVARVVRFLLSDESRAVNGEQIVLFGHPEGPWKRGG